MARAAPCVRTECFSEPQETRQPQPIESEQLAQAQAQAPPAKRPTLGVELPWQTNMEGLAPFFKDSGSQLSLVVFENDSDDGTREAFKAWSEEESRRDESRFVVDLIGCGPKNPDCELGVIDRYDNMNLF